MELTFFLIKVLSSRVIVTCWPERENTTKTTVSKRYDMVV